MTNKHLYWSYVSASDMINSYTYTNKNGGFFYMQVHTLHSDELVKILSRFRDTYSRLSKSFVNFLRDLKN